MSRASSSGNRASNLMAMTVSLGILQRAYRGAADKAVAHLGISQALAWPLVTIGRQGSGARQRAVADLLGIEGPTLVRAVDQLVATGMVERREDPQDGRAKTLHLTPAGMALQTQIEKALHALRETLFKDLADADIEICLRVFSVWEERLGRTPFDRTHWVERTKK